MLSKSVITLIFTFFALQGFCQVKAVTEYGDTIFVFDNGTWSFELEDIPFIESDIGDILSEKIEVDTILGIQSYPVSAKKTLKTKIGQFEFKYDDKVWKRIPPAGVNDEAEFAFQHRKKDIWCIIITEESEIGTENLLKISRSTMSENFGKEVKVIKTEHRNVNGTDMMRSTVNNDISGLQFAFDGYVYSDSRGSTQITAWTSTNLWEKYEADIIDLLNGIVIIGNSN